MLESAQQNSPSLDGDTMVRFADEIGLVHSPHALTEKKGSNHSHTFEETLHGVDR